LTCTELDNVQVDRIVPYDAMTREDIMHLFDQLLSTEQSTRLQTRRPRLEWDRSVLPCLADDEQMGGYSANFARQGGSHAVEVLEQLLEIVDQKECEHGCALNLTCDHASPDRRIDVSCDNCQNDNMCTKSEL
jgi:hypothetical protein